MKLLTFFSFILIFQACMSSPIQRGSKTLTFFQNYFEKRCLKKQRLTCYFRPTKGNTVEGSVYFDPVYSPIRIGRLKYNRCNVRIIASIKSLTPGLHGFHIHAYGDMRSADGTSTGGHFTNPSNSDVPHGFPQTSKSARHWGDFGNLNANSHGVAAYNRIDQVITLNGILGRGMIIHEGEDQGPAEQPSGAAGSRQAHCIIGDCNYAHTGRTHPTPSPLLTPNQKPSYGRAIKVGTASKNEAAFYRPQQGAYAGAPVRV